MARSLLFILSLVMMSEAFPWFGPRETLSATSTANWSPAPTNAALLDALELFKRSYYPENLCGWQGPQAQNVYCSTGSSCAWFTDYKVVGCCKIGGDCDAVYTSCIDGGGSGNTGLGVTSCPSNSVCYLNTYPGDYYQYGCGSTSVGENVVTSYAAFGNNPGSNPQVSIAIVYSGGVLDGGVSVATVPNDESTSSASPTTTSPFVFSSNTGKGGVQNSTPTTNTIAPTSSGNSASTGSTAGSQTSPTNTASSSSGGLSTTAKIAIGVVVPVALIAILALAAFFFLRRRKQNTDSPPGYSNQPEAVAVTPGQAYAEDQKRVQAVEMVGNHERFSPQSPMSGHSGQFSELDDRAYSGGRRSEMM